MNVVQLTPEVRLRLGLRDDDPVLDDATILKFLNAANQSIATKRDWPWLFTEAENTTEHGVPYVLPGGYTRTVYITVDGRELVSAGLSDLARYRSAFGAPSHFAVAGDYIVFSPLVPENTTYDVIHGFYQAEPELITEIDAPLLPDEYNEWLIIETAVRAALRANKQDRLAALREEAKEWEKQVIDSVRRSGSAPRIKRTRPSIWQDVN